MAKWRLKAAETFGFELAKYSYASGKRELFADLVELARKATSEGDGELLGRIVEYVCWASKQTADDLQSVVDLAFFLPLFREEGTAQQVLERFPTEMVAEKRRLLIAKSEPAE